MPLLDDEECFRGIATLTEDIRNGTLCHLSHQLLTGSFLIAIPKKNSSIRPIAISDTFYKLACYHALAPLQFAIRDSLSQYQFGVATPGGAEAASHLMQSLLFDSPPPCSKAVLKCDITNAFNTCDRNLMLKNLYNYPKLEPIWRLASWAYSTSSPLWIRQRDGSLAATLLSTEGTRQGCPLAMLLFSIAIDPTAKTAAERVPTVTVSQYADNTTFIGPRNDVTKCHKIFVEIGRSQGFSFNPHDDTYYHPEFIDEHHPLAEPTTEYLTSNNIPIIHGRFTDSIFDDLGVPYSLDFDKVSEECDKLVESHNNFFSALTHKSILTQRAFMLLRIDLSRKRVEERVEVSSAGGSTSKCCGCRCR